MSAQKRINILKEVYPGKELVEFMADALSLRSESDISVRMQASVERGGTFSDRLIFWDASSKGRSYYEAKNIEESKLRRIN